MSPETTEALRSARAYLQMGRPSEAVGGLRALLQGQPELTEAARLLAAALRQLGQSAEAVAVLRRAAALAPGEPALAMDLALLLTGEGQAGEAADLLAPLAAAPNADLTVLTAQAAALKAQERFDEAVAVYERAVHAFPANAVAEHNLAGVLGDLQRYAESQAAALRAFDKGLDAPETWLVLAKAQQGLGEFDAAERSYEEALRRRPAYADALGELAQLIWMRTEDVQAAQVPLDRAINEFPMMNGPRHRKAKLLEYAGDYAGAYAALMASPDQGVGDPLIQTLAAHLASIFDPPTAVVHAERARALAPGQQPPLLGLAEAQLAAGDPAAAAATAQIIRERWPLDQHGLGLQAVAWRMLGDPRYGELYDYQRMVAGYRLETPDGWASLEAYLADLAGALERMHSYRTHPVGQSVRHGSQTQQSLSLSSEPAIRAFFGAIDGPIRRHIAWLGEGDDPLRRRITGGYAFNGMWSVRLRPGGFHADHLHQKGWLSSACYVVLPSAIERGHEGWIEFGKPGVPTAPPLEAEHFVKPEPGLLVLFPSYMWHGTVPFEGDETRLTIAFDVVPA